MKTKGVREEREEYDRENTGKTKKERDIQTDVQTWNFLLH